MSDVIAGGAPGREPSRPGVWLTLTLAAAIAIVPTGLAYGAASIPVPPGASSPVAPEIQVPPGTAGTGAPLGPPASTPQGSPESVFPADCPTGVFDFFRKIAQLNECVSSGLQQSVSWMFNRAISGSMSFLAFNPSAGTYLTSYMWHFWLTAVAGLLGLLLRFMIGLVRRGARGGAEVLNSGGPYAVVGLPVAFSFPWLVLLVESGIAAVTGNLAGVLGGRMVTLGGEIGAALGSSVLGELFLAAMALVLLVLLTFGVDLAYALRQVGVYVLTPLGQCGLIPALAFGSTNALRTYGRLLLGTLLFPLLFLDILVLGIAPATFVTAAGALATLTYAVALLLFALVGGFGLAVVFGVSAEAGAFAALQRARSRRESGGRRQRRSSSGNATKVPRQHRTRFMSSVESRWDARRSAREERANARRRSRSRVNPMYWFGRKPSDSGKPPSQHGKVVRQPHAGRRRGRSVRGE